MQHSRARSVIDASSAETFDGSINRSIGGVPLPMEDCIAFDA